VEALQQRLSAWLDRRREPDADLLVENVDEWHFGAFVAVDEALHEGLQSTALVSGVAKPLQQRHPALELGDDQRSE
jgi:hypothetical protein